MAQPVSDGTLAHSHKEGWLTPYTGDKMERVINDLIREINDLKKEIRK
ncbi:hypothetical protein [Enterobacter cancerogenus]|nr:hypothetical protein [Enterobacter cancerogenus]